MRGGGAGVPCHWHAFRCHFVQYSFASHNIVTLKTLNILYKYSKWSINTNTNSNRVTVTVSASVLFPFLLLNNTCFQDVMLSRFLSYGVSFEETPLVIIIRESLDILTSS